jgi:hypothetical protein
MAPTYSNIFNSFVFDFVKDKHKRTFRKEINPGVEIGYGRLRKVNKKGTLKQSTFFEIEEY